MWQLTEKKGCFQAAFFYVRSCVFHTLNFNVSIVKILTFQIDLIFAPQVVRKDFFMLFLKKIRIKMF